jgi:hypothetical protein
MTVIGHQQLPGRRTTSDQRLNELRNDLPTEWLKSLFESGIYDLYSIRSAVAITNPPLQLVIGIEF